MVSPKSTIMHSLEYVWSAYSKTQIVLGQGDTSLATRQRVWNWWTNHSMEAMRPRGCSHNFAGGSAKKLVHQTQKSDNLRVCQENPLLDGVHQHPKVLSHAGQFKVWFLPMEDSSGNKKTDGVAHACESTLITETTLRKSCGAVERPKQSALKWQTLPSKANLSYGREKWMKENPKVFL